MYLRTLEDRLIYSKPAFKEGEWTFISSSYMSRYEKKKSSVLYSSRDSITQIFLFFYVVCLSSTGCEEHILTLDTYSSYSEDSKTLGFGVAIKSDENFYLLAEKPEWIENFKDPDDLIDQLLNPRIIHKLRKVSDELQLGPSEESLL